MKVVFSPKCLEYKFEGHPESPQRVALVYQELSNKDLFEFIPPMDISEEDILLVHSVSLLKKVKDANFWDPDTPCIKDIFSYAFISCATAITAGRLVLQEKYTFALTRPPGHHASQDNIGGFCYFNNIAVAVEKLLRIGKRAGILDLDVHHGNGTQQIFIGKKDVLYCSLHQVPLYPGTGLYSEKNCFNFPLPAGSGFKVYKEKLEQSLNIIRDFNPHILAVSMGFDTYKGDPLSDINLEVEDYYEIGISLRKLNLPIFFVLEGGYSQDIGRLALSLFRGLLSS